MLKRLLICLAIGLFMTSCATQSFTLQNRAAGEPAEERMQSFFLHGIGQTQRISAASICGGADKVVKVETSQSFVNILLTVMTSGLYSPRQARVYCSM